MKGKNRSSSLTLTKRKINKKNKEDFYTILFKINLLTNKNTKREREKPFTHTHTDTHTHASTINNTWAHI